MSETFGNLKTILAQKLRDPDAKTFITADIEALVLEALAEVGRIAPRIFQEDIDLVADQLNYTVLSSDFGGEAVPEVEVARVELWDTTTTPERMASVLQPASGEYVAASDVGWSCWGGKLYLTSQLVLALEGAEDNYLLRLWGYAPYAEPDSDDDVVSVSSQIKWAVIAYAKLQGLNQLLADRDLYTQWQTHSGNTDISPAGLMNQYSVALSEWRQRSRSLLRLRSRV